jgi:hypothetical protein
MGRKVERKLKRRVSPDIANEQEQDFSNTNKAHPALPNRYILSPPLLLTLFIFLLTTLTVLVLTHRSWPSLKTSGPLRSLRFPAPPGTRPTLSSSCEGSGASECRCTEAPPRAQPPPTPPSKKKRTKNMLIKGGT